MAKMIASGPSGVAGGERSPRSEEPFLRAFIGAKGVQAHERGVGCAVGARDRPGGPARGDPASPRSSATSWTTPWPR
ncbi:hypothetical protein QJS66_16995 [Kocuria rhizophila]|nr:hypothetical protein QJS66_16995 [Kocuria rhizophila]